MEYLLHYTWKHKLFPLGGLLTTDGEVVEVIDPGLRNRDAGPDFFNAKLKVGGTMWVGNVEIHTRSSEWYAHGHHTDPAYDNVVMHVVEDADRQVINSNGRILPTLVLPVPARIRESYDQLLRTDEYPRCHAVIPTLSRLMVHSFLSALHAERLGQKAERVERERMKSGLNWEDAFFVTLSRNFGFGVNGDSFERWARHIPLNAVAKHRDNLFQVEAIFFGQAGLLEEIGDDEYYLRLQKEYRYLAHKFELSPIDPVCWRFLRMRPANFPHVRLAQLAYIYHKGESLLSRLLEVQTIKEMYKLLETGISEYWQTHYTFMHDSPKKRKQLSLTTRRLIVINTVCPFFYAYGRYKDDEKLCNKAVSLLEGMNAENNRIIRIWEQCGLKVKSAADSQALIQLKREYCDVRKCLHCRFGYEYLKKRTND